MGNSSSDDGNKKAQVLCREIKIEHLEEKENNNYTAGLLVNNIPVDERTNHGKECCSQVSYQREDRETGSWIHSNNTV
jgi:hypothetical protein